MTTREIEQRKLMAVQLSTEIATHQEAVQSIMEVTIAIVAHGMVCNDPNCKAGADLRKNKRDAYEKLQMVCEEMAGTVKDIIAADDAVHQPQ